MKFSDIPGQDDVKRKLRNLVDSEHIPHALLLEGTEGCGKFALARALAQYVHCTNRQNGDSCGKCPSCLQHQSLNHIDTIYTFPVVKKNSKKTVSDDLLPTFREFITADKFMDFESWLINLDNINAQPKIFVEEAAEINRKLIYTSHNSKYTIVLIWLAERMNEEAANKLLKIIEEPLGEVLFILTSNDSRQILPTIYSRTQRVEVHRYSEQQIADILVNDYGIEPARAQDVARLCDGNINAARKMLSVKSDNTKFLDYFIKLMRDAYQRKVGDLKAWSTDVASLGREQLMQFFQYCCRLVRENFIYNLQDERFNSLNEEERRFSVNFARFINVKNVEKMYEVFNDARNDVAANGNAKIICFDVAIKIILLIKSGQE